MPTVIQNRAMTFDVKLVPLSDNTSLGTPNLAVTSTNQSATVSEVIFLRANASGHLVS